MKLETPTLPKSVLDLLASCPKAGKGVHTWLFRAARNLHGAGLENDEMAKLLSEAVAGCGRAVPRAEIRNAINNSIGGMGHSDFKPWPPRNPKRISEINESGQTLADLIELSPVKFGEAEPSRAEEIVDALFPGDPLLCVASENNRFNTRRRERWRGALSRMQFLVPNPMSAVCGKTVDGRISRRTINNTGPRKYLVIESDEGTFDSHAALLLHLAATFPLVLAVHSGGKSLHGWFACGKQEETTLRKFMEYAVSIGADPVTWTKCQLVRMPDGTRSNGNRQRPVFFDPSLAEVA